MSASDAKAIAEEIKALSPAAQLRLAADLIERRMFTTAKPIVQRVADELTLVVHATPTGSADR